MKEPDLYKKVREFIDTTLQAAGVSDEEAANLACNVCADLNEWYWIAVDDHRRRHDEAKADSGPAAK